MNKLPELDDKTAVWNYCEENIYGFSGLIDVVQGMIVGWTIATENFIKTPNMVVTLRTVQSIVDEFNSMTNAWGFEK